MRFVELSCYEKERFISVHKDAALQLRDLVPPSSSANNSQQDGLDNKRPKHVVLSDTIMLVKELQDKV